MSSSSSNMLQGDFLVKGSLHANEKSPKPLLLSTEGLSFWGGIDPLTGIIIDSSHPLQGRCVTDTILCLPSGRGSCTASQVLLELILNNKAPAAFVFRDVDGLACVGAIVAQEVFEGYTIPDMIHVGTQAYAALLEADPSHGCVLDNGSFLTGNDTEIIEKEISHFISRYNPPDDDEREREQVLQFTDEENAMLEGASSEAQRMAFRVLFQYAHLGATGPPKYLDITQAHIDGCTYIGPGGLEFTQRLVQANGKVLVPTTLNSVSADRRQHQALGVPADYAANSIALGDAYLALGCTPSFTCAPYLLPTEPKLRDDIAWGESNAVVYANSVLGAHTEKYADYLDICCALTGKVPAAGVHLPENRKPQVVLDATDMLQELLDATDHVKEINLEMLFPTLGHVCGALSDGKVPVLVGFDSEKWASLINTDHLKAFCAAFGTTGKSPLVHIAGITPEVKEDPSLTSHALQNCPTKTVNWSHCEDTFALLNNTKRSDGTTTSNKVDMIALGNPHLSAQECANMVSLIQSMGSSSSPPKKDPNVRILACLSREIHAQAEEKGYIQPLKDFGVELINDTCWCMLLDAPVIPADPNATILTNSGKYAHYGPGLTNRRYRYGSTEECIRAAISGSYPTPVNSQYSNLKVPKWLVSPQSQQIRSFISVQGTHAARTTFTASALEMTSIAPLCTGGASRNRGTYQSLGRYALRAVKAFARR